MVFKVLCTSPIKENWESELASMSASVTTLELDGTIPTTAADDTWDGAFITPEAFGLFKTEGVDALVVLYQALADLVSAGRVAWVHICASGLDVKFFSPLMAACHEKGAALTHCPGVYGVPIAHYVLGHMLSTARMIKLHADNQAAKKYESLIQRDLRSMTVGIVGAGGIGSEVARLSKGFGMATIGWRRNAAPAPNYDEVLAGPGGLSALLAKADFVVVCVPKTPATASLLGAPQFAQMKPTAWLINVSRGTVLDESALIAALPIEGQAPAGAIMDVFAVEPLAQDSPLWDMPNVVITPHDSWRTDEALKDNHRYFLSNVALKLKGEQLNGLVSEEYLTPALAAAAEAKAATA